MTDPHVSVEAVMAEVRARVRERLRTQLRESGGSPAFDDPALFMEVEALLHDAARATESTPLILPELLGDPATWRLTTGMEYKSHREPRAASLVVFIKRRVLMPLMRWMFEYSRDNFERQRRVNLVLFACVQELALETARLRHEMRRLSAPSAHSDSQEPLHRT